MLVTTLLTALLCSCLISTTPIELTDQTWEQMLHGHWMVEFYAPWCSACQKFKPIWDDFSTIMLSEPVKVAAIDMDQYSSLSGRFRITALPTVYYIRDGVFRQYNGERSLDSLKNYFRHKEWQKTEPVPSYMAPNSILMSLAGFTFNFPLLTKDAFTLLQDQYGLPTWLVYVIIIVSVIIVGVAFGYSILSLTNSFVGVLSKVFATPVPRDESNPEILLKSQEETATAVMTSISDNVNDHCEEEFKRFDVDDKAKEQTKND